MGYNPIKDSDMKRDDANLYKRSTIQRALVLETVRELKCHVTADEVYDAIKQRHPGIGRGTVYRNLNLLSDMGEIRKVEVPGGADRYDHQRHAHYHVKCVTCDRVFDLEMDFIADLANRIKDDRGFAFAGHDILFKGVCPECKSNG